MNKGNLITLILLLLLASCAEVEEREENRRFIEVSGYAEKKVDPDEFYISIFLDESDPLRKRSVETLEDSMKAILAAEGIDVKKALTVTDLSSHFGYWWRKRRGQIYTSKSYELRLSGLQQTDRVGHRFEQEGISNFSISRVSHTKIEEIRNEVRADAVKNALNKAEYLAKATGDKIGHVIFIQEPTPHGVGNPWEDRAMVGNAAEVQSASLDFRQITVTNTVMVRFELE